MCDVEEKQGSKVPSSGPHSMSDKSGEKLDAVSTCKDAAKSLACILGAKMNGDQKRCMVFLGECEIMITY